MPIESRRGRGAEEIPRERERERENWLAGFEVPTLCSYVVVSLLRFALLAHFVKMHFLASDRFAGVLDLAATPLPNAAQGDLSSL